MSINKRDISRLDGIHPILIIIFYEVQKRTRYNIHVAWKGGRRSDSEQIELFRKRSSKKNGTTNKSKHQLGLALDFVVYQGTKAVWYPDMYEDVWMTFNAVAQELNTRLRWGGDWNMNKIRVDKDKNEKFLDAGHVEMI